MLRPSLRRFIIAPLIHEQREHVDAASYFLPLQEGELAIYAMRCYHAYVTRDEGAR